MKKIEVKPVYIEEFDVHVSPYLLPAEIELIAKKMMEGSFLPYLSKFLDKVSRNLITAKEVLRA